jgi:hypothetical protein
MTTQELINLFFSDLKKYNATNFKTISRADLTNDNDPIVRKSFSSVITRYFIFREKHPEITDEENKILYFKLKLDLVARYFSEYPDTTSDNLIAFQLELKNYIKEHKSEVVDKDTEEYTIIKPEKVVV